MRRLPILLAAGVAGLALAAWGAASWIAAGSGRGPSVLRDAPEFPSRDSADWLNSEPLTMAGLRSQVVLLDVFTFG